MPILTCSVEECNRDSATAGLCNMHYLRLRRHGSVYTLKYPHYKTPEESFLARTERAGDCLAWTGAKHNAGHGIISVNKKNTPAHRYAWERVNGPIPDGLLVDHICHNRICVEITHLRLATRKQNGENLKGAVSGSSSGIRGVSWDKSRRLWVAQVKHNGKNYYLGGYGTEEEAGEVARLKRVELFTYNNLDRP